MGNVSKGKIIKTAALNAVLTSVYIAAISSFLFYAPKHFGSDSDGTVIVPIVMLSLFVLSAAITGSLVFGRPVLWYLDGKREEAILLLGYTILVFFVTTALMIFALVLFAGKIFMW